MTRQRRNSERRPSVKRFGHFCIGRCDDGNGANRSRLGRCKVFGLASLLTVSALMAFPSVAAGCSRNVAFATRGVIKSSSRTKNTFSLVLHVKKNGWGHLTEDRPPGFRHQDRCSIRMSVSSTGSEASLKSSSGSAPNNQHVQLGANYEGDHTLPSDRQKQSQDQLQPILSQGLYRPFVDYAWTALKNSGLVEQQGSLSDELGNNVVVPMDLRNNTCRAKGMPLGCTVNIEVEALRGRQPLLQFPVIRMARYAHLETVGPIPTLSLKNYDEANLAIRKTTKGALRATLSEHKILPGIHVLNFVIFPHPTCLDLPIFGADLVSLPGDKHLILIDFQPVRNQSLTESSRKDHISSAGEGHPEGSPFILPSKHFYPRVEAIHKKYSDQFEWGGDIPSKAKRFISPFALWTRFNGRRATNERKSNDGRNSQQGNIKEEAFDENNDLMEKIQTQVMDAFKDYFDLYLDLLLWKVSNNGNKDDECAHKNVLQGSMGESDKKVSDQQLKRRQEEVIEGHEEYLSYRIANDPARPMLQRLYGEEWTERLIRNVLFNGDL